MDSKKFFKIVEQWNSGVLFINRLDKLYQLLTEANLSPALLCIDTDKYAFFLDVLADEGDIIQINLPSHWWKSSIREAITFSLNEYKKELQSA